MWNWGWIDRSFVRIAAAAELLNYALPVPGDIFLLFKKTTWEILIEQK
jgi:hypothetical protein